ncbi:MAG TPA: TetR/AcrR family transcriptional regulator [Spirochaetia bacterium]|nr:TetR/AcrR family transcriptional regulator [Spirochaetia bacterium]
MNGDSRVERKKREARERILSVCEDLFLHKKDFDKTTMREIARRADVSVGTLYLHFKTKADILATFVADFTTAQRTLLEEVTSARETAAEKLEALLETFREVTRSPRLALYSQIPRLYPRESIAINDSIRDTVDRDLRRIVTVLTAILRLGEEDGTLNVTADSELTAVTLVTTLTLLIGGLTVRSSPGPVGVFSNGYDIDDIFSTFTSMLAQVLIRSDRSRTDSKERT